MAGPGFVAARARPPCKWGLARPFSTGYRAKHRPGSTENLTLRSTDEGEEEGEGEQRRRMRTRRRKKRSSRSDGVEDGGLLVAAEGDTDEDRLAGVTAGLGWRRVVDGVPMYSRP